MVMVKEYSSNLWGMYQKRWNVDVEVSKWFKLFTIVMLNYSVLYFCKF